MVRARGTPSFGWRCNPSRGGSDPEPKESREGYVPEKDTHSPLKGALIAAADVQHEVDLADLWCVMLSLLKGEISTCVHSCVACHMSALGRIPPPPPPQSKLSSERLPL